MSIFEDFYNKEKFIADRRIKKNQPSAYKLWRNRVIAFLDFCDQQQVFQIRDVRQKHYEEFIARISLNKSSYTLRDWKYALDLFFVRAHLDIRVQTSPRKQAAKRRNRARSRLIKHFDKNTTETIMRILDGLI